MALPAAERATQIPPAGVAGMCEKANSAVYAVSNTVAKLGMGLQNRIQRRLILPNKRFGAVVLVPIRAKREKLLDGYGKKARFSVMMLIVLCTPSSYLLDANASRGRARFFMRAEQQFASNARTNDLFRNLLPECPAYQTNATSLRVKLRS